MRDICVYLFDMSHAIKCRLNTDSPLRMPLHFFLDHCPRLFDFSWVSTAAPKHVCSPGLSPKLATGPGASLELGPWHVRVRDSAQQSVSLLLLLLPLLLLWLHLKFGSLYGFFGANKVKVSELSPTAARNRQRAKEGGENCKELSEMCKSHSWTNI